MDVGQPSLDQLRIFLTVADEGSFSRAARKLGLSRQAMYRRIERYALRRPPQRSP